MNYGSDHRRRYRLCLSLPVPVSLTGWWTGQWTRIASSSREDRQRTLRRWPAPESRSIESRAVGIRPVGETKILKGFGSREIRVRGFQRPIRRKRGCLGTRPFVVEEPVLRAGRRSCDETRGRGSSGGFSTWVVYLTRGRISRSAGEGRGKRILHPESRSSRRRRCEIASSELDPSGGLDPAIYHSFSQSDSQVGGCMPLPVHRELSRRARERTRPRLRQGRSDTQRLTRVRACIMRSANAWRATLYLVFSLILFSY